MSSTQVHKRCYYERAKFCYLCSKYIPATQRRSILTETNMSNFIACYEFKPDLRYSYKPTGLHDSCRVNLSNAVNKRRPLKYSASAIWKKPDAEHKNCLICNTEFYFGAALNPTYPTNSNVVQAELNPEFWIWLIWSSIC